MRIGPATIEKESDHDLWVVHLHFQSLSYLTRWYPSNIHTRLDALRMFVDDARAIFHHNHTIGVIRTGSLLDDLEKSLIFLEIEEV